MTSLRLKAVHGSDQSRHRHWQYEDKGKHYCSISCNFEAAA